MHTKIVQCPCLMNEVSILSRLYLKQIAIKLLALISTLKFPLTFVFVSRIISENVFNLADKALDIAFNLKKM